MEPLPIEVIGEPADWLEVFRGKLEGGRGVPQGVGHAVGEEVPGTVGVAMGSEVVSDWEEGGPDPRSIKRERSFLSRAWMSSTPFPCGSLSQSTQWIWLWLGTVEV